MKIINYIIILFIVLYLLNLFDTKENFTDFYHPSINCYENIEGNMMCDEYLNTQIMLASTQLRSTKNMSYDLRNDPGIIVPNNFIYNMSPRIPFIIY
jgi:hypothetical protein